MVSNSLSLDSSSLNTLAQELSQRQWQITCAESCTGGLLASALTSLPGSSAYFEQSWVTYANAAKIQLGVPAKLLMETGAVSKATVEALASAALVKANADIAVAISGVAGPGGGTPDKPVGTVWVGCVLAATTTSQCYHFDGDRQSVRIQSVNAGLKLALGALLSV